MIIIPMCTKDNKLSSLFHPFLLKKKKKKLLQQVTREDLDLGSPYKGDQILLFNYKIFEHVNLFVYGDCASRSLFSWESIFAYL